MLLVELEQAGHFAQFLRRDIDPAIHISLGEAQFWVEQELVVERRIVDPDRDRWRRVGRTGVGAVKGLGGSIRADQRQRSGMDHAAQQPGQKSHDAILLRFVSDRPPHLSDGDGMPDRSGQVNPEHPPLSTR